MGYHKNESLNQLILFKIEFECVYSAYWQQIIAIFDTMSFVNYKKT